jgi:threonyl-tRNA synthetase
LAPAGHLEKQPGAPASDYLVAFADDSTHALSMLDDVPAGASSLHYHTFDSHPAARDAFWRSAAFLLAASLAHQDPQIRIASPPTLQTAGSGGDGFALSWLPAQEADSAPAAGQASSSASGPLEAAAELANSQPTAKPLSSEQLQQVAGAAMKAAGLNMRFEYVSLSREAAAKELGANALKLEQLATLPDEEVRLVRLGVYVDICPPPGQPLLPDTRTLKRALQLVDCSVASWVPQLPTAPKSFTSSSQCLLHVRGIAFPKKPQLAAHLAAVAAAARESDHREIGKAQRLFMTNPASPGTPFILPHGTRLGRKVERVVRDLYDVWGYDEVITPQLMRKSLWQTSGHWENYRADMFGVRGFVDVDAPSEPLASVVSSAVAEERKGCCAAHDTPAETAAQDEFGLKPMNCPGHCLIFADEERSYRVLPLRLAEFSPLHR